MERLNFADNDHDCNMPDEMIKMGSFQTFLRSSPELTNLKDRQA